MVEKEIIIVRYYDCVKDERIWVKIEQNDELYEKIKEKVKEFAKKTKVSN